MLQLVTVTVTRGQEPLVLQQVAEAGHNDIQDHADYRVSLERFLR
ncbi:hypothetical protein SAMN04487785_106169 [Dyella jiangningensis]|nr:hypothetical protein BDW41_104294 [Dyella sp. AtDHG13]SDK27375.1 hypothetical protein SAMN04487785_106169 [Dyella jiangningensis]